MRTRSGDRVAGMVVSMCRFGRFLTPMSPPLHIDNIHEARGTCGEDAQRTMGAECVKERARRGLHVMFFTHQATAAWYSVDDVRKARGTSATLERIVRRARRG